MTQKEIHELIKLVNKNNIGEFKLKNKDFSISIRSKNYKKKNETTVVPVSAPTQNFSPPPAEAPKPPIEEAKPTKPAAKEEEKQETVVSGEEIKSPMVGTFYRKPAPDKEVFVKVGDSIKKGDILCVIEAMKLFNEIESEVSGTITKVLVDDATPVEYDQPLFLIEPA